MAKWAARATLPHFHYSPKMFPIFYSNSAHTDISVPLSSMWHREPPVTFLASFKWSNAIHSIKGFAPFYDKQPRPCPFCNTSHPLDPISYITFCSSTFRSSLKNGIISNWPIPLLQQIKKTFLPLKPSMPTKNIRLKLRDLRNILRYFVPISISASFIQIKDFDPIAEFKNRNKQLTPLIPKVISALHNSALQSIPDPTSYNDSS